MGFYIRKSFRSGPFRVNLSKSGLGFSSGFKGFRVGTGPRGSYVNAGRNGLYYRKSFGRGRRRRTGHPFLSLLLVIVVLVAVVHFWKALLAIAALIAVVWIISVLAEAWAARPPAPTESAPSSPVPLQEFCSSEELRSS